MKKIKPGSALAVPGNNAMAALPKHLEGKTGKARGLENVRKSDILLPRLKLLQRTSPEVNDKGMKPGTMVNSLTGENLGDTVFIVPIMHYNARACWKDLDDGGGIICASDDNKMPRSLDEANKALAMFIQQGKMPKPAKNKQSAQITSCSDCPLKDWKKEGEAKGKDRAPLCTENYIFAIIVENTVTPIALPMSMTKNKVAKRLLSLASMSNGLDFFAKKYKLGTVSEKSGTYTYFNFTIDPAGYSAEADYRTCESLLGSFTNMNIAIHDEGKAE